MSILFATTYGTNLSLSHTSLKIFCYFQCSAGLYPASVPYHQCTVDGLLVALSSNRSVVHHPEHEPADLPLSVIIGKLTTCASYVESST